MTLTQHAFRLSLWAAGCVGLAFVIFALTGCAHPADVIAALAKDPSAVSVHEEIDGPGWTQKIDVTRVNSTNTAASANSNGTAVNVPNGASVNPGQAQPPSVGTVTQPGQPVPAANTTLAPAVSSNPQ